MESTTREGVQEFIRACDTLAEFAHQHIGLTEEEREIVVVNFLRALEKEIVPSHPLKDLKDFVPPHSQPHDLEPSMAFILPKAGLFTGPP